MVYLVVRPSPSLVVSLCFRFQGKEVATEVRLLPQGTVIFEDISIEHFEGTVTKVIPKVPNKNQVTCLKAGRAIQIRASCELNAPTVGFS